MVTLGKNWLPRPHRDSRSNGACSWRHAGPAPWSEAGQHGGLRAGVNVLLGRQIQIHGHFERAGSRRAARLEVKASAALVSGFRRDGAMAPGSKSKYGVRASRPRPRPQMHLWKVGRPQPPAGLLGGREWWRRTERGGGRLDSLWLSKTQRWTFPFLLCIGRTLRAPHSFSRLGWAVTWKREPSPRSLALSSLAFSVLRYRSWPLSSLGTFVRGLALALTTFCVFPHYWPSWKGELIHVPSTSFSLEGPI